MANFILFISITLNGIAILAIINLYLRQNRLIHTEQRLENSVKEMEDLISSYLLEMKDENTAFIERFRQLHQNNKQVNQQLTSNTDAMGQETATIDHDRQEQQRMKGMNETIPPLRYTAHLQAKNTYRSSATTGHAVEQEKHIKAEKSRTSMHPPVVKGAVQQKPEKPEEKTGGSLYDQIMMLQQKGLTTGEIAKQLNKGKTEVELLIKLKR